MRLLALDTSGECCSVALWQHGELLSREAAAERGHGGRVLAMIDAVLAEGGVTLAGLDALAFGRGPGAFTGLRLAASVCQGLAFAAGLSVIPVSDLRALAQQLLAARPDRRVLVCQDARMGEVYWAGFRGNAGIAHADTPEQVAAPGAMIDAALAWLDGQEACGAGSGFARYPALSVLAPQLLEVSGELGPRAREIAILAAADGLGRAVPPEQALPVYVRDKVAVVPGTERERP